MDSFITIGSVVAFGSISAYFLSKTHPNIIEKGLLIIALLCLLSVPLFHPPDEKSRYTAEYDRDDRDEYDDDRDDDGWDDDGWDDEWDDWEDEYDGIDCQSDYASPDEEIGESDYNPSPRMEASGYRVPPSMSRDDSYEAARP